LGFLLVGEAGISKAASCAAGEFETGTTQGNSSWQEHQMLPLLLVGKRSKRGKHNIFLIFWQTEEHFKCNIDEEPIIVGHHEDKYLENVKAAGNIELRSRLNGRVTCR
jgi:hypothetical protein